MRRSFAFIICSGLLLAQAHLKTTSAIEPLDRFDPIQSHRDALNSDFYSDEDKDRMRFELRSMENGYLLELQNFDFDDGIDKFEAWFLAGVYAQTNVALGGMRFLPALEGDDWVVPHAFGSDAQEGSPIRIHRVTGKLSCEGHPPLDSPRDFLAAELAETLRRSKQTKEERYAELVEEAAIRKAAIEEELRRAWLRKQSQLNGKPTPIPE